MSTRVNMVLKIVRHFVPLNVWKNAHWVTLHFDRRIENTSAITLAFLGKDLEPLFTQQYVYRPGDYGAYMQSLGALDATFEGRRFVTLAGRPEVDSSEL